jgi:hypothetical protein
MDESQLVEVYRAKDAIEANMIKGALEEAGIRVRVEGESLQGTIGVGAPWGWVSFPRIIVFENDAARANAILCELPTR